MGKYYVRCRKCETRRVLRKHPDTNHYDGYANKWNIPKCRNCGAKSYRTVKRSKQVTCKCSGYWFPHRAGSKCCNEGSYGPLYQALRVGPVSDEDRIDLILQSPGVN